VRAITLWPEWVYAILHFGKDVENRTWRGPEGETLALHAGKHIVGSPSVNSTILGIDTVINVASFLNRWSCLFHPDDVVTSAIVATFRVGRIRWNHPSKWSAADMWQWPIENLRVLPEPIHCRGMQGLWPVPLNIEKRLR
jgi:hypothetical protein